MGACTPSVLGTHIFFEPLHSVQWEAGPADPPKTSPNSSILEYGRVAVGTQPLKVVTVSCVVGLGTLPSLRLEEKKGRRLKRC